MNKKIVILDLDGTVADCNHRLHFIEGHNRDYQAFYDGIPDDKSIDHIIDLVRALYQSGEYSILAVTGRPITHLRETQIWLDQNFVPYDAIFMRPEGDFRKDFVVKKEILEEIRKNFGEPAFALDDRSSVVKMWRENGVPCLQVAPGDFDKPKYQPGNLILLVGPSGAGKSTHARMFGYTDDQIVSSDAIRQTLCGDFRDQSKNEQVFAALHSIVKTRIEMGLRTVVDATNIRSADRKAFLNIVPLNTEIHYHVINRPLSEKLKTGGWRLEAENKGINLIEKHEQVFQSNIKVILAGDGDPRVKIRDYRKN